MRKKILILDDDNDILEILTILLEVTGYEIKTLTTGDTVFEDIKAFGPDLILMDVMLAGMDGRLICRDIKGNYLTHLLPVVLVSGTHDLAESMLLHGAPDHFITKPFDIDYLLAKIAKQLAA